MEKDKLKVKPLIKSLASIKLAVVVISLIAILTAIGTFVEAKYDAKTAQKTIYHSVWMFLILILFSINLIAVMVDRWPWKKHHSAFVTAHVGILIILLGFIVSIFTGIDGTMRVGIGEDNRFITLPGTQVIVYSSFDGSKFTKIFEQDVDFFSKPPSEAKPFMVPGEPTPFKFADFKKYVIPQRKIIEDTNTLLGSALRFQIRNDRVNVVEWLVQRGPQQIDTHDFGPAQIHLGPAPEVGRGANEIYITPQANSQKLKYKVFSSKSLDATKEGVVEEGGAFEPGWMGLELKVLRFHPKAREDWDIKERETPTPLTVEAVQVEFQGQKHWILLNDTLKFFTESAVFFVTYANQRLDIGFPIRLKEFSVDRYQGTMRAAAYKSKVEIPGLGEKEISMNEPLKHEGLTIYQASFQEAPDGQPTASIFSINKDPGRWLKYLGSLIMSIGVILLFYFKKRKSTQAGAQK